MRPIKRTIKQISNKGMKIIPKINQAKYFSFRLFFGTWPLECCDLGNVLFLAKTSTQVELRVTSVDYIYHQPRDQAVSNYQIFTNIWFQESLRLFGAPCRLHFAQNKAPLGTGLYWCYWNIACSRVRSRLLVAKAKPQIRWYHYTVTVINHPCYNMFPFPIPHAFQRVRNILMCFFS